MKRFLLERNGELIFPLIEIDIDKIPPLYEEILIHIGTLVYFQDFLEDMAFGC